MCMSAKLIVWDDLNASPKDLFDFACNRRADLRTKLDPYVSMLESICVSPESMA